MSWAKNFEDFRDTINSGTTAVGRVPLSGNSSTVQSGNVGSSFSFNGWSSTTDDVTRITIADLSPGIPVPKLVAVIIAMSDPRRFPNKKEPGSERHVLSFTVRDTPVNFINVSCWGSEMFISGLSASLRIGQLVEILQAVVQSKPPDGQDEKFKPWTPSPFQLSVNELRGSVNECKETLTEWEAASLTNLVHVPVKQSNDFYTIADVTAGGEALAGELVSMLVLVKQVGAPREFTSKAGRVMRRCEVQMFDETCTDFTIVIWDDTMIRFASEWLPQQTVVFAADIKVSYNAFKRSMVGSTTAKTVLTVNPDTREANYLFRYGQMTGLPDDSYTSAAGDLNELENINFDEIRKVYTVEEIKSLLETGSSLSADETGSSEAVYGIVYSFISSLNIDEATALVAMSRCTECRQRCSALNTCINEICPQLGTDQSSSLRYDLRLSLADSTATLNSCILASNAAELLLGCSAQEFVKMNENHKTAIKWKYLLERCKIYFKVSTSAAMRSSRSIVKVLKCDLTSVEELVQNI